MPAVAAKRVAPDDESWEVKRKRVEAWAATLTTEQKQRLMCISIGRFLEARFTEQKLGRGEDAHFLNMRVYHTADLMGIPREQVPALVKGYYQEMVNLRDYLQIQMDGLAEAPMDLTRLNLN